jgi:hypothetical protein
MEAAIQHAWEKVVALETNQLALAGFSKTRPTFHREGGKLVKAELLFALNSTPDRKDRNPSAADQSKPFCNLVVSVWHPNGLPGQPVATQRKYRIGSEMLEGYVKVLCSDDYIARTIQGIFESEMKKAEGRKTAGEPATPPHPEPAARSTQG